MDSKIAACKNFTNNFFMDFNKTLIDKSVDLNLSILPVYLKNAIIRKQLVEEYLWILTGDPSAPYYYGLYSKVFLPGLEQDLGWIYHDFNSLYYIPTSSSLKFVNVNFQEIHRSGWQYVVNSLLSSCNKFNGTNNSGTSTTNNSGTSTIEIVDTYIDKTFHWNNDFYKKHDVIPYKKPWVGFIHHTFSSFGNEYNCTELIKNPEFIESLKCCKSIIVLSESLRLELIKTLPKNLVVSMTHPTETVPKNLQFNTGSFMLNKNKMIIQIGAWLRDMFAIYRLQLYPNSVVNKKAVLKPKNTTNYFPPNDIETLFNWGPVKNSTQDMCRMAFENKFLVSVYAYTKQSVNSVVPIQTVTNNQFDQLLVNNIVFLQLLDASAVNTILECIARNTPVLVNKLPATVEMLGEHYPYYFTNLLEAADKLKNPELISKTTKYLSTLNKTKFSQQYFVDNFWKLINSL